MFNYAVGYVVGLHLVHARVGICFTGAQDMKHPAGQAQPQLIRISAQAVPYSSR